MDDMTDPSLSTTITDVQRDRAVEYLQRVYASGELSEELFEQRLGMALTAQTRAELNAVTAWAGPRGWHVPRPSRGQASCA